MSAPQGIDRHTFLKRTGALGAAVAAGGLGVLADVGEFAAGAALGCVSSDPRRADGLALCDGQRTRLLLGNMTAAPLRVRVEGIGARAVRIRYLDEESFERATAGGDDFRREPDAAEPIEAGALDLVLKPYAIARIDSNVGR